MSDPQGVMSGARHHDRGARSGKRNRHEPRRGYEAAPGPGRQPGGGRFGVGGGSGGDTPPRFAHRHHRGGDPREGGYYYEDGGGERGGRRGGYGGRGRYERDGGAGWGLSGSGGGRGAIPKSSYGESSLFTTQLMHTEDTTYVHT